MPDWPAQVLTTQCGGVIHAGSPASACQGIIDFAGGLFTTAAAWPAANRALFIPFLVESTVTAYKMAFEVGAQAGNCDVGIYDELGNRLVSSGSTGVGAAGLQVVDITDTVLTPALYYMAMNCDTVTTLTILRAAPSTSLTVLQMSGLKQAALASVVLTSTVTFANPATLYVPSLSVALKATI